MLQTLWFFLQLALVVVPAMWLVSQPGSVAVNLMGYTFTIQAGIFFVLLIVTLLVALTIYRVIKSILSVPHTIAVYNQESKRQKGYRALTRGFVALAAGDKDKATKYSAQTRQYWPDQNGLPVLLEAQAARLRGEEGLAQNRFEELLKDKDAAFLGIRGLLKSALDEGQVGRALEFARRARKLHPHQSWILKVVYALEIRNHLWSDALETGPKAVKAGALKQEKAISDRVAIHLMRYDYERGQGQVKLARKDLDRAYKLNPHFVPTVTRLAREYLTEKKNRKAASIVEKAWRQNPHPDLVEIWDLLAPRSDKKNDVKRLKWYEDLVAFKPSSLEGQIAASEAAMDLGFWGEAKAYLMVAEKIYPSARVYRLQAVVEQNSTHNDTAIHTLMEKASQALPDKQWTCIRTGLTYSEWSAIAMPHESFNTIFWGLPRARQFNDDNLLAEYDKTALLIDPVL